jgi:hypothetical protein
MRLLQHLSHFETYTDNELLKLKLLDLHFENLSSGFKEWNSCKILLRLHCIYFLENPEFRIPDFQFLADILSLDESNVT